MKERVTGAGGGGGGGGVGRRENEEINVLTTQSI